MSLLNEFLGLKCAGDVLNACSPFNNPEKEITEAMAVVKRLKPPVLSEPNKYTVVDVASGNGLVGVIAAFLLPVQEVIAVDSLPRERRWGAVRKFHYRCARIENLQLPNTPFILTACHACSDLATTLIDIFKATEQCRHLVLMPCCCGRSPVKISTVITDKLGKYLSWAHSLSLYAQGNLSVEGRCLSPCNAVIVASKGGLNV